VHVIGPLANAFLFQSQASEKQDELQTSLLLCVYPEVLDAVHACAASVLEGSILCLQGSVVFLVESCVELSISWHNASGDRENDTDPPE
jgi:hypothetical protein